MTKKLECQVSIMECQVSSKIAYLFHKQLTFFSISTVLFTVELVTRIAYRTYRYKKTTRDDEINLSAVDAHIRVI